MVSYHARGVDLSDDDVDRLFRALADATRRDIVRRTLTDECSISDLAHHYDMTDDRRGRERRIRGNPEAIRRAQTLLDGFERLWRGRIDRLDALLADD